MNRIRSFRSSIRIYKQHQHLQTYSSSKNSLKALHIPYTETRPSFIFSCRLRNIQLHIHQSQKRLRPIIIGLLCKNTSKESILKHDSETEISPWGTECHCPYGWGSASDEWGGVGVGVAAPLLQVQWQCQSSYVTTRRICKMGIPDTIFSLIYVNGILCLTCLVGQQPDLSESLETHAPVVIEPVTACFDIQDANWRLVFVFCSNCCKHKPINRFSNGETLQHISVHKKKMGTTHTSIRGKCKK